MSSHARKIEDRWMVLKAPITSSETELTITEVLQRTLSPSPEEGGVDVSNYGKVRVITPSQGANLEGANLFFYGFYKDGPGHKIADVDAIISGTTRPMGFFADDNVYLRSVIAKFESATRYEGPLYTQIADPNGEVTLIDDGANAWIDIDLSKSRYRWLLMLAAGLTATSIGGIWKPLAFHPV